MELIATNAQRRIIMDRAEVRNCKYRITATGEVHFYGRMPNSNVTGWWLFAQSVSDAIHCAA